MSEARSVRTLAASGAAVILMLGAALTWYAVDREAASARSLAQARFDQSAQDLRMNITARLTLPRYGMGGLRSTIASLGNVPSTAQFRQAVLARDLPREFPGVRGFGLIVPIPRAEVSAFLATVRAEYEGNFSLNTAGNQPLLYVVRSIEPIETNRAALGFDAGSEAMRRSVVEQSLRSGGLAITAPIHLLQVGSGSWGALYITPAYVADAMGRRRPIGLIYAAVDYRAAMADIDQRSATLAFSLADTTDNSSPPLFESVNSPFRQLAAGAKFSETVPIALGGRHFALTTISTPSFDRSAAGRAWVLSLLGSAITALMALAVWLLIAGQRRAVALAKQMTHDLDRLAMVGKLTQDAVLVVDGKGKIAWANPAFYRASRTLPGDVLGQAFPAFLGTVVDSSVHEAWTQAVAGMGSFQGMATRTQPDGSILWLETEIQPVKDRHDRPDGWVVIQSDVTARRVAELHLQESQSFLDRTGRAAGVGGWQIDLVTQAITWSAQTRRIHEVPDGYEPTMDNALAFYPSAAREQLEGVVEAAIATGKGWDLELPFKTYRGREIWVRAMGVVEFDKDTPVRLTGAFQDITLRKRLQLELEESRELLHVTLSSIGDAVVTTDATGGVTWMNSVAERLSGWSVDQAKGRMITDVLVLVSEETRRPVANPIMAALAQKKVVGLALNTLLLARDGAEHGVDDSAAPIFDAFGRVLGGVMVFHDVTEARLIHHEMIHHARHDSLTGLPNRIEFESRAGRFVEHAHEHGGQGVVLFIDLDHFKIVNDSCGHFAGDELLRQVSSIIRSSVRSFDTVARLGGDEFAVLLENCTAQNGEIVAQEIGTAVDHYRFVASDGQRFRVGASIGIASLDVAGQSLDTLLQAADSACYAAKAAGRNRYHVWSPQDSGISARTGETAWGVEVERALDDRAFVLHAQRIEPRSARARSRIGGLCCEILVRLVQPDGTLIFPSTFMQAAERYHLATRLDRWVVQEVFDRLSDNVAVIGANSHIGINLSGQSVGDPIFHEFIKGVVDRARFDVRVICFEITETAAITNLAAASLFLAEMRKRGIRIALDDFGAGVASFGYLKALPVDYLKLDGQFVRGVIANPIDRVSVKSFCEVAEVLQIETIAEFVENADTLRVLDDLDVDFAQGYYIHRPESFDDVLAALPVT